MLTRGVKAAIGIGVLAGTALVAAILVLPWVGSSSSSPSVTLRLVNDTQQTLTVRGCDDPDCTTTWMHRELGPGLEADSQVDANDLIDVFRVDRAGGDACLPVRVHDGYERAGGGVALAARLSQATPCPGTTVLPVPAENAPL